MPSQSYDAQYTSLQQMLGFAGEQKTDLVARFSAELRFAHQLCQAYPDRASEWQERIVEAGRAFSDGLQQPTVDFDALLREGEETLAPIGQVAKEYTLLCISHAHIDMNWMWSWPETVAVTNDTFRTMLTLLDEFPEFVFSQDQASVYRIVQEHNPAMFEEIQQRVQSGRWEVTASQWVEGDENMASGESLCRHLLYTRQYFQRAFCLPPEAVQIDFEPDTFGHPATMPSILTRGGVRYYYHCRGSRGPHLYWWLGPDGSRVLAFNDIQWYMCAIGPQIADALIEYSTSTGMRAMPVLYGVGDHGGGPTRRDLRRIRELNEWPIYPKVRCSTLRRFFRTAEREATQVPEIVGERNFIFPGCYTSQARQKWANRHGENILYVGELAATIGDLLAGVAYPHEKLDEAWRGVLFQQFHDILPGSGVRETNEYAMGKGQEIQATAGMARTNALRALSARVNTEALRADFVLDDVRTVKDVQESGRTLGAGVGYATRTGGESASSAAQSSDRVFLIFNPLPYARHEVVEVTLWDVELPADQLVVSGLDMEPQPVQMIDEGNYWMHTYKTVAFPVKVPGVGYRAVVVSDRRTEMGLLTERGNPWLGKLGSARLVDAPDVTMENEYLRVRLDPASGAVVSLVDKRNGRQWVPEGERCGVFQYSLERNQGMTAWVIGQFLTQEDLVDGGVLERVHGGPHQETFRWTRKVSRSTLSVDITLRRGVPRLEYRLTVDWREMGDEGTIPNLRVRFPLAVEEPTARFETPFGAVERELFAGEEVPAQRWVDLSEQDGVGVTVANQSKYGFSVEGNSLNMTLLRASVDPDPLPDIGEHVIEYALAPHVAGSRVGDMTAVGEQVNQPLISLSADFQEGDLAPQGTLLRAADPAQTNVRLAAVKESQDSITAQGAPALIVRLYEVEGRATEARWILTPSLVPDGAEAVEVDTLERPLDVNGARLDGNTLVVTVPAYGITSVRVGVSPSPQTID